MTCTLLEEPKISRTEVVDALKALVAAASRAPSGDNLQPWRLVANTSQRRLDIHLDADADSSPMNSGQRMAHIACGAAIECALLRAQELGWNTALLLSPVPRDKEGTLLASILLENRTEQWRSNRFFNLANARATNRRAYDGRAVPPAALDALHAATPAFDGLKTHWITDRAAIGALAKIMAMSDAALFSEPSMRHSFLKAVRFDLPAQAAADRGLPLGALEMTFTTGMSLRALKHIPDVVFKATGGPAIFSKQAQRLVQSSSGLCFVEVTADRANAELQIGRAMMRAWLAITAQGMVAQPMMSLAILHNALRYGSAEFIGSLGREQTEYILNGFRSALDAIEINGRMGFLLRFGYADAPSGRAGRLEHAAQ